MIKKPVITATNLSRSFRLKVPAQTKRWRRSTIRVVEAVQGISFEIQAGERVAFIGPNGAGKSTTMRMLTGLLAPSSGSIHVLGLSPCGERKQLAARVGCVFGQISSLWPHLSVAENFELVRHMYSIERSAASARILNLTEIFGLGELLAKRPITLSLGERMRCEIVANLLHNPELVLLDEPSIGLDVIARVTLRDVIRSYADKLGSTVLLTSHDMGDIEGVCERVLMINKGRLVFDGSLASLRRRFVKEKVITIISDRDELSVSDPRLSVARSGDRTFQVHFTPERIRVEEAVALTIAAGGVLDISIEDPSLESVIARAYTEGI